MQVPMKNPSVGMGAMPGVSSGPMTDASGASFGANRYRQLGQLAGAVGDAGNALLAEAQRRQKEEDETFTRDAVTDWKKRIAEQKQVLANQYRGKDASKYPEELEKLMRTTREQVGKGLRNGHQRDAFAREMDLIERHEQLSAIGYRDKQMEAAKQISLDARNALIAEEGANNADGAVTPEGQAINRARLDMIRDNTRQRYAGLPNEAMDLRIRDAERNYHMAVLGSMSDPEKALEYLGQDDVKTSFGTAALNQIKAKVGKALMDGAKKQAENDMRQLGITLGDKYDSEYEIINALRDIEDRDLARIAREEAETVRKARLAMGATPEEKARENRLAREQAATILNGRDPDSPDDDIRDEDEIDLALDEAMADDTEVKREKVRKYAVAELKARRARQAGERRELDRKAEETMAASDWNPAAIDRNWPADLQDKMLDRIARRQRAMSEYEARQEKAEKKAKGIEYLEMPLEQINDKIMDGEWLDIVEAVGAGTPEMAKLERRLKGEDAGGLTMIQYAKNEFSRLVGVPHKNREKYAQFVQKVEDARAAKAKSLKLDNPDMIPLDIQKEIVGELLMDGDFRWWDWSGYFSGNVRRFEVSDTDLPNWKPYDAPPPPPADDLPAFAAPFFGPRDRQRTTLSNGKVLIESGNGTVTIINPDGSIASELSRREQ